jgi:hypothetical protein
MQVSIFMGKWFVCQDGTNTDSPPTVGEGTLTEPRKWKDHFIKENVEYTQK